MAGGRGGRVCRSHCRRNLNVGIGRDSIDTVKEGDSRKRAATGGGPGRVRRLGQLSLAT